jgi:hypothetical protein
MSEMFAGFLALPSPEQATNGWLDEFRKERTVGAVEARFRDMARRYHPDVGGDPNIMATITAARDQVLKELAAS